MRPLRIIDGVLVTAVIVVVGITYSLKHNAEVASDGIRKLQTDIASEQDKIRSLNAEWSFLNQPSRLEAEVKEHADYFQLQPFSPDQIATIDEIPIRSSQPAPAPGTAGAMAPDDAAVKATLARIAAGGALRTR